MVQALGIVSVQMIAQSNEVSLLVMSDRGGVWFILCYILN